MKYASVCALFLLNNEVLSWIALAALVMLLLADFGKAMLKEIEK